MINAGLNVENLLIKAGVMIGLFGILAYVNVNVINRLMLVNTCIMWIVNAERGWQ